MDDVPILGRDDEQRFVQQLTASYGAPAYVRRARQVEEAYELVLEQCRHRRQELLGMVRSRLGLLRALAGEWEALRPQVADDAQLDILRDLHGSLEPPALPWQRPAASPRALARSLRELRESLERFNRRWQEFLQSVDLTHVNALRDGYNRYYLLEKECALRSARLSRQGFRRLLPLTHEALAEEFPLLPVPAPRD